MKAPSPQSEQTSKRSSHFGDKEADYLSKVSVALQNPPEPATVRMWLAKAHVDGLDPQRIYDAAVKSRPPQWDPAPPFSDVAPEKM